MGSVPLPPPFAPSSIRPLRWSHFLLSLDQPWVFTPPYTCRAGPAWFFSLPRCMPSFSPVYYTPSSSNTLKCHSFPKALSRPLLGTSIVLDCLHGIHTPYILLVCVNVSCGAGFIHRRALSPAPCLTQNRVSVHLGLCDAPLCLPQDSGGLQSAKQAVRQMRQQQSKGCRHKQS